MEIEAPHVPTTPQKEKEAIELDIKVSANDIILGKVEVEFDRIPQYM